METVILYHGSNNEFDQFDDAKISAGEGGDLFGKGYYLTNNRAVAEFYAHQVSKLQHIDKVTYDGIFGTARNHFKKDADELAKKTAKVMCFKVSGNFLDMENYLIDDKMRKFLIDAFVKEHCSPKHHTPEEYEEDKKKMAQHAEKTLDFVRNNKAQIHKFRGELEYAISQLGMGREDFNNDVFNYIKKQYDGIKYPSDKDYEGEGSYNYVIYNKNAIKARIPLTESFSSRILKEANLYEQTIEVYHGSKKKDLTFDEPKQGSARKTNMQLDFGTHFTNEEYAKFYAGDKGKVYKAKINISNPLDLTHPVWHKDDPQFDQVFQLIKDLKLEKGYMTMDYYDKQGNKQPDLQSVSVNAHKLSNLPPAKVVAALKKNGFDSVIYEPYHPQGNGYAQHMPVSYIVLNKSSIKEAKVLKEASDYNNFALESIKQHLLKVGAHVNGDFASLYHGTTQANLNKIIKSAKLKAGTWLSEDSNVSEKYSRMAGAKKPVVCTFTIYIGSLYYNGYFSTVEDVYLNNGVYAPKGYKFKI